MAQSTEGPSASTLTRWSALIVIALGIGAVLVAVQDVGVLARWSAGLAHVDTLFPPKPGLLALAFAGAALFVFCVVMLRPRRGRTKPYDRLSLLLAGFVLVTVAYVIAIARDWAMVPAGLLTVAWIVSGVMFVVAAHAAPLHHSLWLRFPFSVAFAVVTLLFLEALAAAGALSPRLADLPPWLRRDFAVIALGLAALAAAVVALRYHDYVYPIAVGAFVALLPFFETTHALGFATWAFSAGMLVFAIVAAVLLARDPRERQPTRRRDRALPTDGPPKTGRRRGRHRVHLDPRPPLLDADSSLMRL